MAHRLGRLKGYTTPSVTGFEIIGEAKDDVAFGVEFETSNVQYWFPPELLEFVGRTSDLEIKIYRHRWLWRTDGSVHKLAG